jgi:hypothetical protein
MTNARSPREQVSQLEFPAGPLWRAVDELLDRASVEGLHHHGLSPLQGIRLRRLGRELPEPVAREARTATMFGKLAPSLLERVRQSCDEPLLVLKGPEVAGRYPPGGRGFGDIDLLTPDAETARRALIANGFVVEEDGVEVPHHLKPLTWPALPLKLELHHEVNWLQELRPPETAEIFEASIPSVLGVEGLRAPGAAHHALILAAHSWKHRPLRMIRDLLDIALLSAESDAHELAETANRWELERLWRTTHTAAVSLFYGGRVSTPLLTWARRLRHVRETTVFEQHLERVMSPFWALPIGSALPIAGAALRNEFRPSHGETWRAKVTRATTAVTHPTMSVGLHDAMIDADSRGATSADRAAAPDEP